MRFDTFVFLPSRMAQTAGQTLYSQDYVTNTSVLVEYHSPFWCFWAIVKRAHRSKVMCFFSVMAFVASQSQHVARLVMMPRSSQTYPAQPWKLLLWWTKYSRGPKNAEKLPRARFEQFYEPLCYRDVESSPHPYLDAARISLA